MSSIERSLVQRIFGVGQTFSNVSEPFRSTRAIVTPMTKRHLGVEDSGGNSLSMACEAVRSGPLQRHEPALPVQPWTWSIRLLWNINLGCPGVCHHSSTGNGPEVIGS
jgi:hypothetical protein